MVPYLFLIVGEILNHISQYANHLSLLIRGEKPFVVELVWLLEVFNCALRMEIGWHKFCAYWFDHSMSKPAWLNNYNWPWAKENDLSKLKGTLLGLNLQIKDVNQLLLRKFPKNWNIGAQ